jgi:hypothetical protein
MRALLDRFQHRLVPALLTAVGVSLVAAGLLSYTAPVEATPSASDLPTPADQTPGPSSLLTFPPIASPSPTASAGSSPTKSAVASRVVIPALDIDLPVIRQPATPNGHPPCNVAMYLQQLHQPGQPGPTYIYAHARTGMFLPILTASKVANGRRMIGMLAQVYTTDDQLYLYEIVEVRRHVTTLDAAFAEKRETLWLQTSEGPYLPGDQVGPKTQVIALPLSHGPADHKEANPKAKPVFCG